MGKFQWLFAEAVDCETLFELRLFDVENWSWRMSIGSSVIWADPSKTYFHALFKEFTEVGRYFKSSEKLKKGSEILKNSKKLVTQVDLS